MEYITRDPIRVLFIFTLSSNIQFLVQFYMECFRNALNIYYLEE
jgi:hypothetical protein